jgi:hypothetical protein
VIFRRGKKRAPDTDADELDPTDAAPEDGEDGPAAAADAEPVEGRDGPAGPTDRPEVDTDGAGAELDLEALDAQDWRADGPFDISEVDGEDVAGTPEAPRIDLGAMLLSAIPGAQYQLRVSEETQEIVSVMLIHAGSALELAAFAAPRSGGLWSELREDYVAEAEQAGGSALLAEGPFGVQLSRVIPVVTPEGEQGYQPSRMWVAEGPRWLLRGIVYGPAALEEGDDAALADLLTAFRQTVVRRGDEAMAPGDLLPLTMPQAVEEVGGEELDGEERGGEEPAGEVPRG